MKVEARVSFDGDVFFQIGKFARQENIDEKQAIRWLVAEGLKSFNGVDKQVKLEAARHEK